MTTFDHHPPVEATTTPTPTTPCSGTVAPDCLPPPHTDPPAPLAPLECACSRYKPMREELFHLARYWAEARLDYDMAWFYHRQSASGARHRASARLIWLAEVLGEDEVRRAVEEINAACRSRMGEDHWRIFTTGPQEEWDRIANETAASLGITAQTEAEDA